MCKTFSLFQCQIPVDRLKINQLQLEQTMRNPVHLLKAPISLTPTQLGCSRAVLLIYTTEEPGPKLNLKH